MAVDGHLKFDTKLDESGFSSGINKLGSIAKGGLKILAGAVAGVTTAMGTGVAAAVTVGSAFESEMSKVAAISGAVGEDLNALTEKAKEMGAKTKFSASESAQAMEYMAMAGWKTADMLGGIEGIMNLAAASGEDPATTSDIVTDALTAFGLAAEDSTHFADLMAATSSNANTNVSMMGDTFKYVAPVAGALGFSAEDCSVAIGLMANSGIKAGQAGTYLRTVLSRMAKPTNEVETAMKALGISMTNSDGSMRSLNEIMGDLRSSFANLSEAEKAQRAAAIGGQEAMSGLLAIVTASDSDFNKLKDSIYNCDGVAQKMADTMQNNLNGQLTILKSALEGFGIEIYESLQEPLTNLSKVGIDAVNELTEAFKENGTEGLIEAGANIVTNFILGITQSLPEMLKTALQVVQIFVENINANLPQLLAAGGQILSTLALGILQLLPTIGQLGLNIILQLASGITANLPQLIPQAAAVILNFTQAILANLPQLIQAGLNMLVSLAQGVANSLPILIAEVPKIINRFCSQLDSFLPKMIVAGAKILLTLGQGIIHSIPTIIANAGQIVKAILNVITHFSLVSQGKNLINGLGSGMKSIFGNISSITKSLIDKIKNPFKIDWSSIGKNIVIGISNGIKSGASAIASAAKNAAKSALDTAKKFLGIHSPSTVFRDEVGKYMAQGMGVGFEKNVPTNEIEKSINDSVGRIRVAAMTMKKDDLKARIYQNQSMTQSNVSDQKYNELLKVTKRLADRPIIVSAQVKEKEIVRVLAKPMRQEFSKNEKFERRLKGER